MPKISGSKKQATARDAIAGVRKRLPGSARVMVGGKLRAPKELVALFQGHLDALDAVFQARVALRMAVAKETQIAGRVLSFLPLLKNAVYTHFGFDAFSDFGWPRPTKRGPRRAAAKALGVQKARATREARGTLGKRQRRKIRGVVP